MSLLNWKAVKARIKEAGLRSNQETLIAIDRKVSEMLDSVLATNKGKKTLKAGDNIMTIQYLYNSYWQLAISRNFWVGFMFPDYQTYFWVMN